MNNNEILIYGAGNFGKNLANTLIQCGMNFVGFLDSYKTGSVKIFQKDYNILDIKNISSKNIVVIIGISDKNENITVKDMLIDKGINVIDFIDVFHNFDDVVEANRTYIANYHIDCMEDYFNKAESENSIKTFWDKNSPFYIFFKQLDLSRVLELACGHGRHVPHYINKAGEVFLVDILEKNIDFCKERFSQYSKVKYYVNNGYDLSMIEDNSITSLFTYDAMVHFELIDIFDYLKETRRILVPGGKALFHHSNNTSDYRVSFLTGKGGRNYMSRDIFAYLVFRSGLNIISQKVIDWGEPELDCITLVEKRC